VDSQRNSNACLTEIFEELTPRELQVLQQMARTRDKEIGDVLKITEHTSRIT